MAQSVIRRAAARTTLGAFGAGAVVVALTTPGYAAGNSGPAGTLRATIAGSAPAWIGAARVVGTPAASSRIDFRIVLPLRNAAAADRLAAAVSNPRSTSYGHYLTPAKFNARFAPTRAQIAAVKSYLSGQGLRVSGVAQGNRWISASGTVRQIEQAFGTTLETYLYRGHRLRGSTSALSVPADVSPLVAGIIGVSQPASLRHPALVQPVTNAGTTPADVPPPVAPCSIYWDQQEQLMPAAYGTTSFPTANCGYTAAQLRGAYGIQPAVNAGDTGSGVTVAIIDAYASPTIAADANALSTAQGEPTLQPGQFTETDFGPFDQQDECDGDRGWNIEESLDVEAVHGLAPGANIHYVGAQNCDAGIDAAVNYVLQNHVADLVSNSYGFAGEDGLGGEVALEHSEFVQAATEGIGFYFSSGDYGDNVLQGTSHPEPDYPASDSMVTGVGGTSLAVTSRNHYEFETAWGDWIDSVNFSGATDTYAAPLPGRFWAGAGGGVSALFPEPNYQTLLVPNSLATLNGSTPMRVVPDVSAVADPETGFLVEFNGSTQVVGGTSLSCPTFVGVQAVASQGRTFPIGFANPLLYFLGLTHVTFHDVVAPRNTLAVATGSGHSLVTLAMDTSLTATTGYDDTTGLGTPRGPALIIAEKFLP